MANRCCPDDLNYLLLQINIVCLLLALIGSTAIIRHPTWFGKEPTVAVGPFVER